jgi:hypothetical protein
MRHHPAQPYAPAPIMCRRRHRVPQSVFSIGAICGVTGGAAATPPPSRPSAPPLIMRRRHPIFSPPWPPIFVFNRSSLRRDRSRASSSSGRLCRCSVPIKLLCDSWVIPAMKFLGGLHPTAYMQSLHGKSCASHTQSLFPSTIDLPSVSRGHPGAEPSIAIASESRGGEGTGKTGKPFASALLRSALPLSLFPRLLPLQASPRPKKPPSPPPPRP